jgi:hypothetical protein
VTDIFREVEEDVRRERLEQLWKQYGDYVTALAALIILGVAGFQLWRVYETRERNKAAVEFSTALQLLENNQPKAAAGLFATLAKSAPGGYAAVARLAQADALYGEGNRDNAVSLYKQIAADSDPYLGAIARVHAGWALVETAPKAELQTLLAPLTDPNSRWRGAAREILGYADIRTGNDASALKTYESIAADSSLPGSLRERASIVATFLKAGGSKNYGTVPAPPSITKGAGPIDIVPAAGGTPHK